MAPEPVTARWRIVETYLAHGPIVSICRFFGIFCMHKYMIDNSFNLIYPFTM